MSASIRKRDMKFQIVDPSWKSLYKIAAVASLLAVLAFLLDMIISLGGEDFNPAILQAVDWFNLSQDNELAGLRALGFINIISLSISTCLYLALYIAHRDRYPTFTTLALVIYLVGAAIYISNNAAIPMLVLSDKYATASTETQRLLIAAAGEAVLAKGADFTPGSFTGFFFTEIAGLGFSLVMLRSHVFNKGTAIAGILGFLLLSVFTIWATFIPTFFDIAMILAMVGGLASVAWYLLVARQLFQLGNDLLDAKTSQKSSIVVGS